MRVLILGAGSQGAIVADALLRAAETGSPATPIGFVDDFQRGDVLGLPVLGGIDALASIAHDALVIAIGDNARRRTLADACVARGETLVTARHPFTSIAPDVAIGHGSMISAGAIVTPRATIGRGVLLNTKSSVDHDSIVGAFAHIAVGATVGGHCVIGDEAMIGLGASVSSGCRVGARSIIGAGAVVVRDIPDDVIAYGVPARVVRSR
ncbi:MAG TPA: acetyltransferase [Thermoanaerobaculia bacterium]|nr:acetyltransferase [Thermoanaerobaculia bacterium]